ncbi:MAG TPA: hypothetical protein VKU94_01930 [Geobacterales bacterium]|nr:hypothetical protein [Geobacterales bacterium]
MEKVLLKLIAELKLSEFDKACKNAGLSEEEKQQIILSIEEMGE